MEGGMRMADREKVIRAVDSCFDYWLDQHRYIHPLELEHVRQIKADALALLKEQDAVEPFHKCSGKSFSLIEDSNYHYCPYCGKPITWAKQERR